MSPMAHGGASLNDYPLTPRSPMARRSSPRRRSRRASATPASLARVLLARSSSRGTGTGAGGGPAEAKTGGGGGDPSSFVPRVSSPLSPPRMRHRSSSRSSTPAGRRLFSFASSEETTTTDDDNDADDDAAALLSPPRLVTVQVMAPAGPVSRAAARVLRGLAALARCALAAAAVALVFCAVWSPAEQDAWRGAWEREQAEERARTAALGRMWCFLSFALLGGEVGGPAPALLACGG